MGSQLRCLVVQQPFAWAICAGLKNIENRTWTTKHRGDIVIVASAKTGEIKAKQKAAQPNALNADHLAVGAAIGIVTLVDVVPLSEELEANPWAFGPYCWKLDNARIFAQPIPCKGKLNLYNPDPDLAVKIEQQLSSAKSVALDPDGAAWLAAMSEHNPIEALVARANNYEALQNWESQIRLTATSFGKDNKGDRLWIRAQALFQLEKDTEALDLASALIKLEPDNLHAYNLRGLIYDALDKGNEAEADYGKVVELCPDYYDQSAEGNAEQEQ